MEILYLVTGAAGYLGGEVCRQLVARGLNGRALVLPGDKTAQYIPKEIEQCEGDLCDTAFLERFFKVEPDTETIVLHCASMVALGNERRELVMKVNVQGTQNIIDQCFAHPECKKLVYVGSTGSISELPGCCKSGAECLHRNAQRNPWSWRCRMRPRYKRPADADAGRSSGWAERNIQSL